MSDYSKIICDDCLIALPTMPDKSVDLCVTSPPYNMNLRINKGRYCSRQIVKELSTKYEAEPDNKSMAEYLEFNKSVIEQCLRVSKLTFINYQMVTGNKPALFSLMGHFSDKIKEFVIWDKEAAQPAMADRLLNSQFEFFLVLEDSYPQSRQFSQGQFARGTLSNLWKQRRGKKVAASHGAVFPEGLVTTVISNFSREGEVVLDPFMGTGTTGVVCKKLGRNFIGIEKHLPYVEISRARIKGA